MNLPEPVMSPSIYSQREEALLAIVMEEDNEACARVLPMRRLLNITTEALVRLFVKFLIVFVPPTVIVVRSKYKLAAPEPPIVRSDVEPPVISLQKQEPDMVTVPFNVKVLEPIIKFPPLERLNAPFTIRF